MFIDSDRIAGRLVEKGQEEAAVLAEGCRYELICRTSAPDPDTGQAGVTFDVHVAAPEDIYSGEWEDQLQAIEVAIRTWAAREGLPVWDIDFVPILPPLRAAE